jgi:integrase/recombinase XerD
MKPAEDSLPLAELVPSWKVALQAESKSERTLKHYLSGVEQFLRWCERTGTTAALDRATVNTFVAALLADGKETSTAVARYQALRQFARWLVSEGELPADALLGTKPPKLDVKAVVPLTDTELKKLLAACKGDDLHDRRDEAIVRLMAETGLRAAEVVNLKVADVDIGGGRAVVHRGKGGKGRVVPFSPQTARALDRYIRMRRTHKLASGPALWLGERGRSFQYTGLYRALTHRAELAGLTGFYPHLLRNTYASRWLAAGGTEGGLMAVAGWSNRAMLDRYTRATASERAADEAKRLNLGDI